MLVVVLVGRTVAGMRRIADGIWRWSARHPEWHPGEFGAEVACFALHQGRDTVLIDPLVPGEGAERIVRRLDDLMRGRLTIAITIAYHARSAAELAERYTGERTVEIIGPANVASRLPDVAPFRAIAAGDRLPHAISAHAIGSPLRAELPLHLPRARALAFGDAVAEHDGALRVWVQKPPGPKVGRWYHERLLPTLEPLLALDFDRVLVTHGKPVMRGGRRALRAAFDAGPWYHRG